MHKNGKGQNQRLKSRLSVSVFAADSSTHLHAALERIVLAVYEEELNLRKAFKKFDKNNSQALSLDEFTGALGELGFCMDSGTAQRIFDAFDLNRNGEIASWEFVKTIRSLHLHHVDGSQPKPRHRNRMDRTRHKSSAKSSQKSSQLHVVEKSDNWSRLSSPLAPLEIDAKEDAGNKELDDHGVKLEASICPEHAQLVTFNKEEIGTHALRVEERPPLSPNHQDDLSSTNKEVASKDLSSIEGAGVTHVKDKDVFSSTQDTSCGSDSSADDSSYASSFCSYLSSESEDEVPLAAEEAQSMEKCTSVLADTAQETQLSHQSVLRRVKNLDS